MFVRVLKREDVLEAHAPWGRKKISPFSSHCSGLEKRQFLALGFPRDPQKGNRRNILIELLNSELTKRTLPVGREGKMEIPVKALSMPNCGCEATAQAADAGMKLRENVNAKVTVDLFQFQLPHHPGGHRPG
jgi:hypothetical protein